MVADPTHRRRRGYLRYFDRSAGRSSDDGSKSSSTASGTPNGLAPAPFAAGRSADAFSDAARFAGLPETRFALPFLGACLPFARLPVWTPGMPGIPGM